MATSYGSNDYLEGALQRLEEAQCLWDAQQWVGVVYLAGRAVECLFRSLLWLQNPQQKIGHDLKDLLKRAGLLKLTEKAKLAESDRASLDRVRDAVNELAVIWSNSMRYAGLRRFTRDLKDKKRNQFIRGAKVKGDPVKANAKSALEACETVISFGEPLCKLLKKG